LGIKSNLFFKGGEARDEKKKRLSPVETEIKLGLTRKRVIEFSADALRQRLDCLNFIF
jgi:hypothetical protein